MILPLALAIIRIKRRTGKSIHEIIARLLDEIDPQIVALLQPYNLDYYSYTLTRNSYYDLSSTLEIIKYFLVNGTSKFHNQLVLTFLAKIKSKSFTPQLQQFTLECLQIIGNSSHTKLKLLWFYHFLLKYKPSQVGPFCLSNMYKIIKKKRSYGSISNATISNLVANLQPETYPFSVKHINTLVVFHFKLLKKINYQPATVKALLIIHDNPAILHISMLSC